MSRLRRGKSRARGSQPNGISETARPRARIASASRHAPADRCGRGRRRAPRWCRLPRLARCAAASMPRASPDDDREAGFAEVAREPLGEFACRPPTRCARRRWRPSAARAPPRCRAPRAAAAHRRSSAAAADSRARRCAMKRAPSRCAAFSLALGIVARTDADRRAVAPPRRARSGSASSARARLP